MGRVADSDKDSGSQLSGDERRHNHELRERLNEIVALARKLSQSHGQLSTEVEDETRQRIEWLAEEIWDSAVYGPLEERD